MIRVEHTSSVMIRNISVVVLLVMGYALWRGVCPFSSVSSCEPYKDDNETKSTLPVPTNPNPHKEMVFYSTPKNNLIDIANIETSECSMPQNEAYYIHKSQIAAVPDCRLSTLRSTFEKNSCRLPFVNREPLVS
jgi:hypothetical protein